MKALVTMLQSDLEVIVFPLKLNNFDSMNSISGSTIILITWRGYFTTLAHFSDYFPGQVPRRPGTWFLQLVRLQQEARRLQEQSRDQ